MALLRSMYLLTEALTVFSEAVEQKLTDVLSCPVAAQLETNTNMHGWLQQVTKKFNDTRKSTCLEYDDFREILNSLQATCDAYSGETDL